MPLGSAPAPPCPCPNMDTPAQDRVRLADVPRLATEPTGARWLVLRTEAADLYIGYFENRYGEQWVFTFDRATGEASLRGGDAGWARAHPVRDGRVDGLIMAPEETAWLQACWSATRA